MFLPACLLFKSGRGRCVGVGSVSHDLPLSPSQVHTSPFSLDPHTLPLPHVTFLPPPFYTSLRLPLFQGYKFNRAIMLPTVARVTQVIVGEMGADEAIGKINADMQDALKQAQK